MRLLGRIVHGSAANSFDVIDCVSAKAYDSDKVDSSSIHEQRSLSLAEAQLTLKLMTDNPSFQVPNVIPKGPIFIRRCNAHEDHDHLIVNLVDCLQSAAGAWLNGR
jgi:hypothetical protein